MRSKIDAKPKKLFFVGYSDNELSYRLWNDQIRNVIKSKDMIFNENIMYKDMLRTNPKRISFEVRKTEAIRFLP